MRMTLYRKSLSPFPPYSVGTPEPDKTCPRDRSIRGAVDLGRRPPPLGEATGDLGLYEPTHTDTDTERITLGREGVSANVVAS